MTEFFEHIWSATRLGYPDNARIPKRDVLAVQQLQEDERRRTLTQVEQYQNRRRSSLGVQKHSLLRELDETKVKAVRAMSVGHRPTVIIEDSSDVEEQAEQKPQQTGKRASTLSKVHPTTIDEDEDEYAASEGTRGSSIPSIPFRRSRRRFGTIRMEESNSFIKQYPVIIHSEFHRVMFDFCESRAFYGFILIVILLNCAMLMAQTIISVQVRCVWYFSCIDSGFLGIYIFEMVLKLYVWRIKYFYEGWNWLDFTIVVCNIIDFALPLVIQNVGQFNGAAIFRILRVFRGIRALRALRVLRTIRFLANLQVIMTTILQSIRSIGAIVMLILLFMYMFAVIGRGLYSNVDPAHFGNLLYASFTLFQLLTLDDWFDIYNQIVARDPSKWHVILYLLLYIVVEYFIFLNLFVAVLVDNFHLTIEAQNAKKKNAEENSDDEDMEVYSEDFTDSETDSNYSDDVRIRKGIEEYYPELPSDVRDRLKEYFRLRAALGYNMQVLADQDRILEMMVDLCSESKQDD